MCNSSYMLCAFLLCTNNLNKKWVPCNTDKYHPGNSKNLPCVYVIMIGLFNHCKKIYIFENLSTSEESFNDILDGISSHVCSVVTHCYFRVVGTDDTKESGYYIIHFTSNTNTIQLLIIIMI